MRILFWSETFWPRVGGVENLAARLLPALRARGYEFAVVTWENTKIPDEMSFEGIPVYRFPFFSGGRQGSLEPMMENARRVAKLKRDFGPDLVHVNSYGRSVLFHLITARGNPVPMLLTLHQAPPNGPVGRETLLRKVLETADWVTACSASVLDDTGQLVRDIIPRSSFIHNALEIPAVRPRPLSFDPPRLLFVGRLVAEKGLDRALSAFAAVRKRFPDARFVVAGDGPERANLERRAVELTLVDSTEFLGAVPPERVTHLINEATLVVIPSRLEGFGLVALEAALMARPVVAARVGGLPEIVIHGQTGLLIESDKDEALPRAITFLIERPELAAQMGQAARRRAQEVFLWERHVNAYDALYQQLVH